MNRCADCSMECYHEKYKDVETCSKRTVGCAVSIVDPSRYHPGPYRVC